MTWQRIDDDTYIDNTLVTCAEYQLFIDEMREQGEYRQPDHWVAFKFPAGQALTPIMGMRFSDGIEFCNWLTEHEKGRWKFRLPKKAEAMGYLMATKERYSSLGYWIASSNTPLTRFAWFSQKLKDPRKVKDSYNWGFDHFVPLKYDRALDVDYDLEIAQELYIIKQIAPIFDRDLDRNANRDFELAAKIVANRNAALAMDRRTVKVLHGMDLNLDIFTLQERIAGRSPAFEGIRLVKERIR